ncbi:MAG: protein kinase domain-containing protein [Chloroflexia bacterium]
MNDLSGRRIGKYELERVIGRGGMAVVYLGRDTSLNRPVALKVLDPATVADERAVDRFRNEAILAANLEHPHIVPIYDVNEADGLWFLAMRYVPGESLREMMAREGPMPLKRVLPLLRPVAAALDYAHQHGVTHRDVKPGNILVELDGNVVLTDFGIARAGADAHMTRVGQVMGTADYLAPEQIRGEEATHASDIYSLGILLYEMLTGECPFAGETIAETLYKQVSSPPPPLSSLRPDLPPGVQPILDCALDKNPARRYSRASEMLGALAAVGDEAAAARTRPTPRPATQAEEGRALTEYVPSASLRQEEGWAPPAEYVPPPSRRLPAAGGGSGIGRLLGLALVLLLLLGIGPFALAFLNGKDFDPPAAITYTGPRRPAVNGPDLHANRAKHAPTIDGKLNDWTGATPWAGNFPVTGLTPPANAADLSASFLLGYDETNFYLGATVVDNVHVQNSATRGFSLWKGDDVELWFDTDLPGDFNLDPGNADDYQIGFSGGDFRNLGPEAVFFRPDQLAAAPLGVRVAAVPGSGGGYTLEAAVPWRALHMSAPAAGSAVGFCASVGDNDVQGTAQQQHLVGTCRRLNWPNPTTFGNLFF